MTEDLSASRVPPITPEQLLAQRAAKAELQAYAIAQESSSEEFTEWSELSAFNPLAMARRFEPLEVKTRKKDKEEESSKTQEGKRILEVKRSEEVSDKFQKRNPELQARTLLILQSRISKDDSAEEILRKVREFYTDYFLADEALDFLLETADIEFAANIREAKESLNNNFGREVRAGRNTAEHARAFSAQGLGNPTALRDIYRDITGNPREPTTLFEELNKNFSFEKMRSLIDFLLHAMGADLKSKGPSISRAELHRLMTEARTLQAILGVYKFFRSRMRLIESSFRRRGLNVPDRLKFEELSRLFTKFLQERYPSVEKALHMAIALGLSDELEAQLILYTQFRDAVRGVAPRLFRSEQHRQDVLMTYIETIEDIDDKLEEDEEEEDEEEDKS